jgi:hypothetical protein
MNFQDKSVAIFDGGLFVSLASILAKDFGRVGYFNPWENPFADGRELMVGEGIPDITRIKYWDLDFPQYDLLCFPDVLYGDLQMYYRRQGKRVWGAGKGGELELLRWETKRLNKEAGLPVNECYKVKGTAALRQFFIDSETDDGWYVKISGLRGLGETWHARNYADARGQIDELDHRHAPLSYIVEFIVEAAIPDADEIGYDGYCIGGEFPESSLWGIEDKDKCYFGMVSDYKDLPEGARTVNDALSTIIKEHYPHYRQFLSTEIREKDGQPHPIDYTCRHASPAGECVCANMENISEVIWEGAEGNLVQPLWRHKYCAQVIICSETAIERSVILDFPEENREHLKIYNHCRVDDQGELGMRDYFVRQVAPMKQLGSVVALGDDPEGTIALCKERAKSVKGFDLEREVGALDKIAEDVIKLSAAD